MSQTINGLDLATEATVLRQKRSGDELHEDTEYTTHPLIKRVKIQRYTDGNDYCPIGNDFDNDPTPKYNIDVSGGNVSVENGKYSAGVYRDGVIVYSGRRDTRIGPNMITTRTNHLSMMLEALPANVQLPELEVGRIPTCAKINLVARGVRYRVKVFNNGQIEVERYFGTPQKDTVVFQRNGSIVRNGPNTGRRIIDAPALDIIPEPVPVRVAGSAHANAAVPWNNIDPPRACSPALPAARAAAISASNDVALTAARIVYSLSRTATSGSVFIETARASHNAALASAHTAARAAHDAVLANARAAVPAPARATVLATATASALESARNAAFAAARDVILTAERSAAIPAPANAVYSTPARADRVAAARTAANAAVPMSDNTKKCLAALQIPVSAASREQIQQVGKPATK